MNSLGKGKNLIFTIIIIPMMITPVAVGLIWRLMLHPQLGIINYLLSGDASGIDIYTADINEDGEVNIADVNTLIDIILGGPDNSDGFSDVNKDSEVNIADINAIINIILTNE